MRLIDADKLHYHRVWIASIKKGEYSGMKSAVVVFADEIDKNKTARVDAVPVVRCQECEHADGYSFCDYFGYDDFCSHGERKGAGK